MHIPLLHFFFKGHIVYVAHSGTMPRYATGKRHLANRWTIPAVHKIVNATRQGQVAELALLSLLHESSQWLYIKTVGGSTRQ